ncbi:MAG: AraC family transcriptional regulator [Clostridia bacterium]|nr:AraC family transcriptional regulator [Clostridia bacterium]
MLTYQSSFPFELLQIENQKNAASSNHFHPYYELVYVKKGSFCYFIADKTYTVSARSVVLVPKDVIHKASFEQNSDNAYYLIHFFEEFLTPDTLPVLHKLFAGRHVVLSEEEQNAVLPVLTKLFVAFHRNEEYREPLIKAYFCEFMVILTRFSRFRHHNGERSLMEDAAIYINHCIKSQTAYQLTLENVAKRYYMNSSAFSKKFKKEIGIGFKEYVVSAKIIYSKKLMETTTDSITKIAFLSGFEDSNYFSTVFKKMESISPSEYIKMTRSRLKRTLP